MHFPSQREVRRFIQTTIKTVGGPHLQLNRIELIKNPRKDNYVIYTQRKREIYRFAIATTYWMGPPDVLAAAVIHEYSNSLRKQNRFSRLDWIEMRVFTLLQHSSAKVRHRARELFEGFLGGRKRLLRRKLAVDREALRLSILYGFSTHGYLHFLNEERSFAQLYQSPLRRSWYEQIGERRMQEAARFVKEHRRIT